MDDRQSRPAALLGFFLLLHVLNQVDRNLIASFGPEIVQDLGLSLTQFGIVTGIAFSAVYAVMALTAGVLADRFGRTRIMAAGLATWSGFTALSGAAQAFASLVAVRPFVATGEATLIPTATAILSERFSPARRASAIGIFFMGVPLGIGASFFVAGKLGPILGWRGVFVLLGAIGVAMVLGVLRLTDRRPSVSDIAAHPDDQAERSGREILIELLAELRVNADLRLSLLGSILMHVYLAGTPFVKLWLVNERGFRSADIAATYGSAVVICGIVGAALGGTLSDWYARRFPGGRAMFLALLVAALAPFIVAFRFAEPGSPLFYAGMAAGILFFSSFYGPSFAVLQSAAPARLRASATGLAMLLVNVVALGLGGLAIGAVSDVLKAQGRPDVLTVPLIAADLISLLTILCFARIGWREVRRERAARPAGRPQPL